MESPVQCPVCTLFLHNGMSLETHLDTHPKDQVIKALCSITKTNNSCASSRTPTPAISERSYRSRSRTPANDDSVPWNGTNRSSEHERYWARTPSGNSSRTPSGISSHRSSRTPTRTPSRTPSRSARSVSRNCTPDIRLVDNVYETTTISTSSQNSNQSRQSNSPLLTKPDKMQRTYPPASGSTDYGQQYMDYSDQPEEVKFSRSAEQPEEVKYSRSAEYSAMELNNIFNSNYNVPMMGAGAKMPQSLPHVMPRKRNEPVKVGNTIKPNNLLNLVKNNISGMQCLPPPYLASRPPPYQMVPSNPTFVQKNVQNVIMAGGLPNSQIQIETKSVPPLVQNHFNQLSSGTFTPGTTVVTQNSQYFYQEMVQNIDPKSFVSPMPPVFTGHENVTNVAQTSSMYQNVMLVDQFGNASCMYTPQSMIPKSGPPPLFQDNRLVNTQAAKPGLIRKDQNKTLIIEVGPILPPQRAAAPSRSSATTVISQPRSSVPNVPIISPPKPEAPSISITEKVERSNEVPSITKGLKILSNIKVEVPVQHIKSMINTVMDLTGSNDAMYPDRSRSPDKILPDIDDDKARQDFSQPSTACGGDSSNSFELKKYESATSSKDLCSKTSGIDKIETDFGDSCPVPDLICNEKPSISPCSELSESGDNSVDRSSVSPKPQTSGLTRKDLEFDSKAKKSMQKPVRSNPLRLNNIYVKKNKKILQIKNSRSVITSRCELIPIACSSTSVAPENFAAAQIAQSPKRHSGEASTLKTISIEEIRENEDMDHSGEEKPPSKCEPTEAVNVKEEFSSSNECAFSNEAPGPARDITALDPLRPITGGYGGMSPTDFDDDATHRELLDLEGASKSKQFVTMMNDNYFGDNIYADYFTPDRVEAFDDKGPTVFKDNSKEAFSCSIWGEPSSKESEFVLPNFIHESYKIAEDGVEYTEGERGEYSGESKGDMPPLNICADERMPPRGELSGQESNGDMESSWTGIYSDVPPAEPYDLMARESWVSDGSELDVTDKRDTLEDDMYPKTRMYACLTCGSKHSSLKEVRAHKVVAHAPPSCSKTTYSRLLTARAIKKEEKVDEPSCAANILSMDTKETITSTIIYDTMEEAKPKLSSLHSLLKEGTRRRRDFACQTCKVDFLNEPAFSAHLKIHPLECPTCGKCFHRRANLRLHVKTHLGLKDYKCDVCEKRFMTRQKLSEHHNIHTGRAPYKCTFCDDTFRRYSNMVQHRDRHHLHKRAKTRDFVCFCGLVFHSKAKYIWHKETHAEKPRACLYCSDKFVHAASLTRHLRRSHNELYLAHHTHKTDVTCPICKQVYLRTNLRAHLLTHSGKRPYACVICNKAFTTKWNLKLHRWTHMSRSAKPFKCNLCKSAFIRHTEYVSHMNAHKSVRPYTCNICGCQFIRKYNCQRHVREHEMQKKFVCKVPECGKKFHRSYYLSEHMKVHSGARPFSCELCEKTSSNKSNHNKHMKIHYAREMVASEA